MSPSKLPRSVVRGRRIVIGLLVVSAAVGFCVVAALLVLLVPLVGEALP
jgi:hypothetical protein